MDHVLLPTGIQFNVQNIFPCIAGRDYVGIAFREYALRNGFTHAVPQSPTDHLVFGHYATYEMLFPTAKPQLEKFIQTWAFFSLLQEILSSEFRHDDFVVTREINGREIRTLCTKGLPEALREAFVQERSTDEQEAYKNHVLECFKLASQVRSSFERINRKIALSVDILLDTVRNVGNAIEFSTMPYHLTGDLTYAHTSLIAQLIANGWCPSEARFLLRRIRGTSSLLYVSALQRKGTVQDHSKCQGEDCSALQTDTSTYVATHIIPGCTCELLAIDSNQLDKILADGKLPLLTISSEPNATLSLVSSDGDREYIAVSHVWADGLGNPHANALHVCRLQQLQEFARKIPQRASEKTQSDCIEPLIWLDTLCCPAKPGPSKTNAMRMMRQVYVEATHVLVLDNTLTSQSYADTPQIQAAASIFVAPWNRRLWCFQEGALSKRLWFQFNDRSVELAGVFQALQDTFLNGDPALKDLALEIAHIYRTLRVFYPGSKSPEDRNLRSIIHAVQERNVSVESDEPLCLAAMFDLDVESLAREENGHTRMAKWWKMMCDTNFVPSDIIFVPVPRLEIDNYRWAPKSLIKHYIMPDFGGTPAQMDQRGLLVRYAGLRMSIGKSGWNGGPTEMLQINIWWLRDNQTGLWYSCSLQNLDPEKNSLFNIFQPSQNDRTTLYDAVTLMSASLILSSENPVTDNHWDQVLLVKPKEVVEGCRLVSTFDNVHLKRQSTSDSLLLEQAYQIVQRLRSHEVFIAFEKEQKLHENPQEAEKSPGFLSARQHVLEVMNLEVRKLVEDQDFKNSVAQISLDSVRSLALQSVQTPEYQFAKEILGVKIEDINRLLGLSLSGTSEDTGGVLDNAGRQNSNTDETLLHMITVHAYTILSNRYMTIDEWFPPDTLWCVD